MAFNSFVRRASSSIAFLTSRSIRSVRPYQGAFSVLNVENRSINRVVGGQFPTFVRFLTGPVHEISKKLSPDVKDSLPKEPDEKSIADGLDELRFEIKDGGPEDGYITLVRKCHDEIIEVKVRPSYEKFDNYIETNDEVEEPEKDEDEVLKLFGDAEKGAEDKRKFVDRDIEYLYMLVKIYYGDGYNKCETFFIVAYPDKIHIRSMFRRVEDDTKHLEEFEEFFKQRVFNPSKLNFNLSNDTNLSIAMILV